MSFVLLIRKINKLLVYNLSRAGRVRVRYKSDDDNDKLPDNRNKDVEKKENAEDKPKPPRAPYNYYDENDWNVGALRKAFTKRNFIPHAQFYGDEDDVDPTNPPPRRVHPMSCTQLVVTKPLHLMEPINPIPERLKTWPSQIQTDLEKANNMTREYKIALKTKLQRSIKIYEKEYKQKMAKKAEEKAAKLEQSQLQEIQSIEADRKKVDLTADQLQEPQQNIQEEIYEVEIDSSSEKVEEEKPGNIFRYRSSVRKYSTQIPYRNSDKIDFGTITRLFRLLYPKISSLGANYYMTITEYVSRRLAIFTQDKYIIPTSMLIDNTTSKQTNCVNTHKKLNKTQQLNKTIKLNPVLNTMDNINIHIKTTNSKVQIGNIYPEEIEINAHGINLGLAKKREMYILKIEPEVVKFNTAADSLILNKNLDFVDSTKDKLPINKSLPSYHDTDKSKNIKLNTSKTEKSKEETTTVKYEKEKPKSETDKKINDSTTNIDDDNVPFRLKRRFWNISNKR